MNKRLFVGNLAYTVTEQELSDFFAAAGQVESAKIITDKESGRSRGFGFVEMVTEEEAAKALEELNNKELSGRPLSLSEAKPLKERPANGNM